VNLGIPTRVRGVTLGGRVGLLPQWRYLQTAEDGQQEARRLTGLFAPLGGLSEGDPPFILER
jgi:hypothetical protein